MNEPNTALHELVRLAPALSVLAVLLVLALVVLLRIPSAELVRIKAGRGLFLVGTLALAFLLAAVALVEGNAWAADALKLVIGAFVGAGAALAGGGGKVIQVQTPAPQPSLRPSERMRAAPARPASPLLDHEVHVIKNKINPLQEALNQTEEALRQGWNLANVEAGSEAFGGMLLTFTRPANGQRKLRIVVDGQATEVVL